mmetsp:Transcript_5890/g.13796  ORF Transcript_5890/g.13796 Transcript_5890/m.13796 type:complete len:262 (+) Transcript_5890:377-1162(+)
MALCALVPASQSTVAATRHTLRRSASLLRISVRLVENGRGAEDLLGRWILLLCRDRRSSAQLPLFEDGRIRLLDRLKASLVADAGLVRVLLARQVPIGLLHLVFAARGAMKPKDVVGVALLCHLRDLLQLVALPHEAHHILLDEPILGAQGLEGHLLRLSLELDFLFSKLFENSAITENLLGVRTGRGGRPLLRRCRCWDGARGWRGPSLYVEPRQLRPNLNFSALVARSGDRRCIRTWCRTAGELSLHRHLLQGEVHLVR